MPRSKGTTRISAKNQVTLPVGVLRAAGLQPGDEVVVRPTGPGVVQIETARDLLDQLILPAGTWPRGAARQLRREWGP
jgi:bifunctional DNA-binding transcriptional regulator/antitoxin component of YhaV-PrlF toxin-antitoxin module